MTPLTDDHLAELLRETFVAHEDLVDPTQLELLAAPPRRPRTLAYAGLAAAAAAVIAAVAVWGPSRGHDAPPAGPGLVHPPALQPASDALNQAKTEAVAGRLLAAVPLLPGGTRIGAAPEALLKTGTDSIDTSPTTVTHTRWWTAPGSLGAAVRFYLHHAPEGLVASEAGSTSTSSADLTRSVQYADLSPNPAYTSRFLLLTVVTDADGVAVRADTFVNWRPARTGSSLVGDNVNAIEATLLRAHRLGDAPHVVRRARVIDPTEIVGVLKQVNGWYGVSPVLRRCPPPSGPLDSYVLRFDTGFGPVVMRGTTFCGGGVQLIRRGQAVAPVLDAAHAFRRLVRRLAS